jgi:hypothetical protein
MPKPITPEQRAEWEQVFRETKALADAIASALPSAVGFPDAIEAEREPRPPFRQRLSGLREARNDLLEWASYAPGTEMRRLDHHLKSSIGLSLDDLQSKRLARLAKIREAGRITTDEQFRLAYARVEQIWDDAERRGEFDTLSRLMSDYEERVSRRRKRAH